MESYKYKSLTNKVTYWVIFVTTILALIFRCIRAYHTFKDLFNKKKQLSNSNNDNVSKYERYNESITTLREV